MGNWGEQKPYLKGLITTPLRTGDGAFLAGIIKWVGGIKDCKYVLSFEGVSLIILHCLDFCWVAILE